MHAYMIGKTGTGKSTCLKTQIMQDIFCNRGICLIDPHGDLVSEIFQNVSQNRVQDVIYFDLTDPKCNLKYNPIRKVSIEKRSLVASGMLEAFEKLWHSAWGVKLEHILRYCILSLLDQETAYISDIPKLLQNKPYRNECLRNIVNPDIRTFWLKEFPQYKLNDLLPVLNKVGGLLAHPVIKRVLIENEKVISFRKAMDSNKIILINLSKGHIGADASHILGALFLTSLSSSAFSRATLLESERIPFIIYADEFHNYSSLSLVNMFSELRKFKVGMVLAHQYIHQLDEKIKQAVLGNVGTIISFRVGTDDSRLMANEMYPVFEKDDFINLANYHIYLKLMIDGKPSRPFSAQTITHTDLLN